MTTGTLTASGVGSGIDIQSLVTKLVDAQRQGPETLMNQQEATIDSQVSALGSLKSALSTFQDSLTGLSSLSSFLIYSGTSSDSTVATVSADSTATAGTYTVVVDSAQGHQLATANKLMSNGFADATTTSVGTGNITIANGNGGSFTVNIASGSSTLNDIRDAINNDSNNFGVSATVLNVSDGSGGTVSKLVLSANDTGAKNALTVTADSTISALDGSNLTQVTAGQDAIFSLDGQTVESASNTVTNAISGLTIQLNGQGTTTLQVGVDNNAIVKSVQQFVDAFNTLQGTFNSTMSYNGGNPAPLFSDTTINGLSSSIRDILLSNVTTTSGAYSALSELGITTQSDGTLKLDSTKLTSALQTDYKGVAEIFAGTNGITEQLNTKLQPYTEFSGLLDSKTQSLNSRKSMIETARSNLESRLSTLQNTLQTQFVAMDGLVSSLNSTGTFLTQQLASMPLAK